MSTQFANEPLAPLDDEFYEQEASPLQQAFRRFDDSHLTRFMWVAGDDIPTNDHSGGRYWGLYTDEVIRKRRLMPIPGARTLAPLEIPALTGTAERVNAQGYLAPFEAQSLQEGHERENSMRLVRLPRTVAYEIMGEYEESAYGPALFEHAQLMGDDKRALVRRLYRAIVPREAFEREGQLKPIARRGVLLVGNVTATFLDQWQNYLLTHGAANIAANTRLDTRKPRSVEGTDSPLSEVELALLMLREMLAACARAWRHQTGYLASSREQISSKAHGGKGKRWYDERDERYLLETGTMPINLEEVQAAQTTAKAANETILKGFEAIAEKIAKPLSKRDITAQVQEAVNQQVGEILANMTQEQLLALMQQKQEAADRDSLRVDTQDAEERREEINRAHAERAATLKAQEEAEAVAAREPDDTAEFEGEITERIEPLDEDADNE